jgi:glutamyl-tRNA synthetase
VEKAHWYNHQYLSKKTPAELARLLIPILKEKQVEVCLEYVEQVCELIHDRAVLIPDLWAQSHFFFLDPEEFDQKVVSKIWKAETPTLLNEYIPVLEALVSFTKENIELQTKQFVQAKEIGMGNLMNPLRLTIVGTNAGPGMMDMMAVIGKEFIIPRIRQGIEKIKI